MPDPSDFYQLTRDADSVLAIENPALGDAIHLLPALKLLRDAYPKARLHVVGGPPSFYQSVAPWIDQAWPEMPRKPLANRELMKALRGERLGAVYVFSGHNRANLLANLIGARWRAGRHSDHNKPWWWQPLLFTRTVDYPWHQEPMFMQHWQVQPQWFLETGLRAEERKTYVHVSPYYGHGGKELPLEQYVELIGVLQQRYGRIVLSCGPKERECGLVRALAEKLPTPPWKVYAGNLSVNQYIALVDGARLHLSGDSGGLHVARMAGTPSVCWYRRRWDYRNWAPSPQETLHRVVYTEDTSEEACRGIATADLLAAARDLIGAA